MFGVAADLQGAVTMAREFNGKVGGNERLATPSLAVHRHPFALHLYCQKMSQSNRLSQSDELPDKSLFHGVRRSQTGTGDLPDTSGAFTAPAAARARDPRRPNRPDGWEYREKTGLTTRSVLAYFAELGLWGFLHPFIKPGGCGIGIR